MIEEDELLQGRGIQLAIVAQFQGDFGEAIRLAGGEAPPEEVLIDHLWIDRTNIDQYYPGECTA